MSTCCEGVLLLLVVLLVLVPSLLLVVGIMVSSGIVVLVLVAEVCTLLSSPPLSFPASITDHDSDSGFTFIIKKKQEIEKGKW